MPLDDAYEKALEDLRSLSPFSAASRSGTEYDGSKFHVPFFNRSFLIYYPGGGVEEVGVEKPPSKWLQILLMHYLINAKGIPIADEWVAYRNLPGAHLFEGRFWQLALATLVRVFGNDIGSFREASLSLGGVPMTRTGDAAFRFRAFPRIPVACILHLGDEELPSSINILFDAVAYTYLATEDLSAVGIYLSDALRRYKSESS